MRIEEENDSIARRGLSPKQMVTILFVLFCMAAMIWSFNAFRLKTVTVEGLTRYTKEEFQKKITEGFWNSITPVFCLSDTTNQKVIPFIECYEVEYIDRQTARVIVHEKRVTGCVTIMGRYMYFDKDGIVVESLDYPTEGIPIITGLEFREIVLYQKLQVQKESLFDTILHLTKLIEQHKLTVQEISFDSGYEVTLYIGDITVLLGKRVTYDEVISALKGILLKLDGRVGTLDMRTYSNEYTDVLFKESK